MNEIYQTCKGCRENKSLAEYDQLLRVKIKPYRKYCRICTEQIQNRTFNKINKICKKCRCRKLIEEFSTNGQGYIAASCKKCASAQIAESLNRRREKTYQNGGYLPDPNVTEIRCIKCQQIKGTYWFSIDSFHKTGYQRTCKDCAAKYRKENRNRINSVAMKRLYGITQEEKNRILYEEQNGKCAICETSTPKGGWAIDHSHTSGIIRGILCKPCNSGIGYLEENPKFLTRAIEFITQPKNFGTVPNNSLYGLKTRKRFLKKVNPKNDQIPGS